VRFYKAWTQSLRRPGLDRFKGFSLNIFYKRKRNLFYKLFDEVFRRQVFAGRAFNHIVPGIKCARLEDIFTEKRADSLVADIADFFIRLQVQHIMNDIVMPL
jgi:hypothetical protein